MTEAKPTMAQLKYLRRGLTQAGGKLPLFDEEGQRVPAATIQSCIDRGWAEPWFANPIKPDWLVCRLSEQGRQLLADLPGVTGRVLPFSGSQAARDKA